MIILLKLLLSHFVGDFILQPGSWVVEKEEKKIRSVKLFLHLLLHGALVWLILWNLNGWLPALLVVLFHGVIDIIKIYAQKEDQKTWWFLTDQALHLIGITAIWYFWFKPDITLPPLHDNSIIWIYATALVFITVVSGIVIQVVMSKWSESLNSSSDASLSNAGKYIGILERLLIFTFVVSGHWEAVGFLIAAKSVFRFGDLKESKERKLTEYILIGTLLSFGIALVTGIIVVKLLTY